MFGSARPWLTSTYSLSLDLLILLLAYTLMILIKWYAKKAVAGVGLLIVLKTTIDFAYSDVSKDSRPRTIFTNL